MAAKKRAKPHTRGLTTQETAYMKARHAGRVLNPVPGYKVSTAYHKKGSEWSLGYHTGEDHACPTGTPLAAVSYGHVIGVGWSALGWGASYGNMVIVEKATGDYEYAYCHLSRFNVHLGDAVKPGQVIGWSGETGHVTGPHCHFEARPVGGRFGSDVRPLLVKQRKK